MGVGPSVVPGKQRAHRLEKVDVASRAELDQGDARRRVRDEDVQQTVPRVDAWQEHAAFARDVVHGLAAAGGHTDHFSSHVPYLPVRIAQRKRTTGRPPLPASVVSPPDGGYPLSTGSAHGATPANGAWSLRLPNGRDALMVTTYDDGLDNERSRPAPG